VDGQGLLGLDGAALVNRVTSDVHDATQGLGTDGDGDGGTSVDGLGATDETLGTCALLAGLRKFLGRGHCVLTVHGNAADDVLAEMLLVRVSATRRQW
jgi:hypothetical protein